MVGIAEITRVSMNIASMTYRPLEAYVAGGLFYLAINLSLAGLGRIAEAPCRRERAVNWDILLRYAPALAGGFGVTILCWAAGSALGLVIGFVVALGADDAEPRFARRASRLRRGLRGTPFLVQLFILYSGGPSVGLRLSATTAGIIGLGLYSSAYFSEIFRGGFAAVPRGQIEAAMSVGMTPLDILARVRLPVALVAATPPIVNTLIVMSKETVVLSIITVPELMYQMQTMAAETFTAFDAIFAMAVFYWCLVEVVSRARPPGRGACDRLPCEPLMTRPMIEIRAIGKSFGAHQVLGGVDLDVAASEVVCLIGPSGSGKSTLLRCVNFLETYDEGEVRIEGELIGYDIGKDGAAAADGAAAPARDAPRDRHGVPALQSLAAHDRARERRRSRWCASRGLADRRGADRAAAMLSASGLRTRPTQLPHAAVGRPAAARRDRPRARDAAAASCCSTSRPRRSTQSWSARCWR